MNRKISACELDATTRYDLHTRLDGMPKHNKVCHGDLNPSNIIITSDNMPYIIDWAHVTQGNASADAARTYLLFWLSGDIEGARVYLDLFCKKSQIPQTASITILKNLRIIIFQVISDNRCNACLASRCRSHPENIMVPPLNIQGVILHQKIHDPICTCTTIKYISHNM